MNRRIRTLHIFNHSTVHNLNYRTLAHSGFTALVEFFGSRQEYAVFT